MLDILSFGTVEIMELSIEAANGGYVPTDLLCGGTSTMLNVEKSDPVVNCLSIASHLHERKHNPDVSMIPRRFLGRAGETSQVQDVPAVFEPGTMPQFLRNPATPMVRAIGKLRAFAACNGEDSSAFDTAALKVLPAGTRLDLITPVTKPEKTKPWASDDAPCSRHVNGMYNIMQNVSMSLGNYQSNVNTGGRLLDYLRVATLLRSIASMLFGYEEWLSSAVLDRCVSLKYHVNMDEFPTIPTGAFMTPFVVALFTYLHGGGATSSEHRNALLALMEDAMSAEKLHDHLVPVTLLDSAVRSAVAELSAESRTHAHFTPYVRHDVRNDISTGRASLRPFTLLPKPPSDKIARSPQNALTRILSPWLRLRLGKDDWVHKVAKLAQEGEVEEAAVIIGDRLDPRIPRLAFRISCVHSPTEKDVWKSLLSWLFAGCERPPPVYTNDPYGAVRAALRVSPTPMVHTYKHCYYLALRHSSQFSPHDLLVTADTNALEGVITLRQSLYKRVAKAYGKRYYVTARMAVEQLQVARQAPRRTLSGLELVRDLKATIIQHQWRAKVYPKLIPMSEFGDAFRVGAYLDPLVDLIGNYCRKRRLDHQLPRVAVVLARSREQQLSVREVTRRLGRLVGLDLLAQYDDVAKVRSETLADIDRFICYDAALPLDAGELGMDPLDTYGLTPEEEEEVTRGVQVQLLATEEPLDTFGHPSGPARRPETVWAARDCATLATPDDVGDFLTVTAFDGLTTYDKVDWAIDFEEIGIQSDTFGAVQEEFGVQIGDQVTLEQFAAMVAFAQRNTTLKYKVASQANGPTEPDIL